MVEGCFQRFGLHDIGISAAVIERINAAGDAILVDPLDEVETKLLHAPIAEANHFPELPSRIHMQKREWRLARRESLHRKMKHNGAVFADGIEHDGTLSLGRNLPHDVDAFGLKPLQMSEVRRRQNRLIKGARHSLLPEIRTQVVTRDAGEFLHAEHQVGRDLSIAANPLADGTFAPSGSFCDFALKLSTAAEKGFEIGHGRALATLKLSNKRRIASQSRKFQMSRKNLRDV